VYRLKEGVEKPTRYLGAEVEETQLENGKVCWGFKADQYVDNAVKTVQKLLDDDG
jgi:hypothetical protein